MFGINLSGAEFGGSGKRYGYDYIYPTTSDLDFYHGKGVELVRLPFKWERMQTSLGGELNADELSRMKTFLDAADARGIKVVIDLHNYGRYGSAVIGSEALPEAQFADFWAKLALELKDQRAVIGYDLMNEPHDMGSPDVWPSAAQAAVDAIRTVDMETAIYVEGQNWAGATDWAKSNGNLHISDPADNIVYEAHLYFDRDKSGTYKNSYDKDGAYPDIGVDRVQSFLDWLDEHDYKGFVGEFAVPNNDPRWLTVLDNFLAELDARGVDAAYWGAGSWWGDYPMALRAKDGSPNPQLGVLDDYLNPLPWKIVGSSGADTLAGTTADDTVLAGSGDDLIAGSRGADVIDGGAGSDRVDYAGSRTAVDVDLARAEQLGGDAARDRLTGVEDLGGSAYNDALRGDGGKNAINGAAGDDVLEGRGGADVLNGGEGRDAASYSGSAAGVLIDLGWSAQSRGDAQGDRLLGIEDVLGSAFADSIRADIGANRLYGGGGNDTLEGRGGADLLDGGAGSDLADYAASLSAVDVDLLRAIQGGGDADGDQLVSIETVSGSGFADVLRGGASADTLKGGGGDDLVEGRGGSDVLDGGAGIDTVSYAGSEAGVTVDLAKKNPNGGDAAGDVLTGFENVTGSAHADTLRGTSGVNELRGGGGNDLLDGAGGADLMDGGDGIDTAVYSGSGAVDVDLMKAVQSGGNAAGDRLLSVENLIGSSGADRLSGDDAANVIDGGAGDDRLHGRDGNDVLTGGTGNDIIEGGRGVDLLTGGAGKDIFVFAGLEDFGGAVGAIDTITDFARGDRIDLSRLDARSASPADDAFTFAGEGGFRGLAGELRFTRGEGHLIVQGDVDGDGVADFGLLVQSAASLAAGDFIL